MLDVRTLAYDHQFVTDRGSHGAGRPTSLDLAIQAGYLFAYQLMRAYWRLRRPVTRGALVAIFCQGQVLLVRNSYVSYYSAPGGYLRRHETAREAAVRELREEIDLTIAPSELKLALEVTHDWEGKQDHVAIFTLDLEERPKVRVDHREVVEAFWFSPRQAADNDVFPPLKQVIAAHAKGS